MGQNGLKSNVREAPPVNVFVAQALTATPVTSSVVLGTRGFNAVGFILHYSGDATTLTLTLLAQDRRTPANYDKPWRVDDGTGTVAAHPITLTVATTDDAAFLIKDLPPGNWKMTAALGSTKTGTLDVTAIPTVII
jgi:hypothetical protein